MFTYILNSAGDGYVLTKVEDTEAEKVVIPDTHNSLPVKEINFTFENFTKLKELVVGNNVEKTVFGTFNCPSLEKIYFGKSIYTISGPFTESVNLTDIYYYGTKETFEEVEYENTSSAEKVVDYLDTTIKLDNDKNEDGVWEEVEASYLDENGYINTEVYKALVGENENEKNYQIFTTSAFANMGIEDEKSVKMDATKILSVSDSLDETNRVEIIEVKGKRLINHRTGGVI